MKATRETTSVTDHAGIEIFYDVYRPVDPPRAVVQVLHGWAEHAGRYERLAGALTAAGLVVYADDHRGHGRTGQAAAGGLGDLGTDAPEGVELAVRAVTQRILDAEPGLPIVLLGHSWGSFLAQHYLRQWGVDLRAAVLTGTTARVAGKAPAARNLNERFEPARTRYDWLSRDEAEVDKYIADPWCGFERLRPGATPAARRTGLLPERTDADIPSDLPVLILNGSDDPVGGADGGTALAELYRSSGVRNVELRVYDGARHELFNETNRDEVTADLLAWVQAVLP